MSQQTDCLKPMGVECGKADEQTICANCHARAAESVGDDCGLSIDILDVDRLREWARLLLVHGADISHWGSTAFVASKMQTIATGIEKAVRDIGTMRAALQPVSAPSAAVAWQPISSAPKDGTPVLVWERDYGREPLTGAYVHFDVPVEGYHSGWFDRVHGHSELHPTHWMPLPLPPIPSSKEKDPSGPPQEKA